MPNKDIPLVLSTREYIDLLERSHMRLHRELQEKREAAQASSLRALLKEDAQAREELHKAVKRAWENVLYQVEQGADDRWGETNMPEDAVDLWCSMCGELGVNSYSKQQGA